MSDESMIIRNGTVVDGTGSPAIRADVLIRGDTIETVGEIDERGDIEYDAMGLTITPGFIDMHGHYDFAVLGNPLCSEKILQGITTDVVGNCGFGITPTNDVTYEVIATVASGIIPGGKMPFVSDHAAFFEKLAESGHSINIAALVPHGNLRAAIMGQSISPASADQLDEMGALLRRGLEAGALGMSTGLSYPIERDMKTQEIIAMAKNLKEYHGFYASHIRSEAKGVLDAIAEAIRIGKEAGVAVEISHLKVAFNTRLTTRALSMIQAARDDGQDVTADVYPYTAGAAGFGMMVLPPWLLLQNGPEITKQLADPATRKRVYNETIRTLLRFVNLPSGLRHILPKWLVNIVLGNLARRAIVTQMSVTEGNTGKSLMALLQADPDFVKDKGLVEKTLSLLGREQGGVTVCIEQEDEEKTLLPIIKAPFVMIGTDNIIGHPRTWGCFPRLIGEYVRDRQVLTLEEAIRKSTSLPASRLGLADRGRIAPGCKADIVTFDLATIKDNSTYENWKAPPSGIKHVFVNGQLVVQDGTHLGTRSGIVLKRT
jgi:N-acyl-D-aspartate/D-glutamate deacylase